MDTRTENYNKILGMHLEGMYQTATSIHDIASQLVSNSANSENDGASDSCLLWAIKDLARGQARELEALAEHFQGLPTGSIGYYAEHFGDATSIISSMKQGATS